MPSLKCQPSLSANQNDCQAVEAKSFIISAIFFGSVETIVQNRSTGAIGFVVLAQV
jgi:hypothetical protein